jgi:pyrroline-5-carboxylate reductase
MKKIGILGIGKMGFSILNGIIKTKLYSNSDLIVYARRPETISMIPRGVDVAKSELDLFNRCEVFIIAIKPQSFKGVLMKLQNSDHKPIIVSIAGGITLNYLESFFPNGKIIRSMPNMAATINQSVTAISVNKFINNDDLELVIKIFKSFGEAFVIEERDMDKMVGLNGSFSAFLYYFLDSFIKAGIKSGLSKTLATDTVIKTAKASLALLENDNRSIDQLIKDICSPNGITIEGIKVLKEENLEAIAIKTIEACEKRSIELGKGN